jgi:hypothetical protein
MRPDRREAAARAALATLCVEVMGENDGDDDGDVVQDRRDSSRHRRGRTQNGMTSGTPIYPVVPYDAAMAGIVAAGQRTPVARITISPATKATAMPISVAPMKSH